MQQGFPDYRDFQLPPGEPLPSIRSGAGDRPSGRAPGSNGRRPVPGTGQVAAVIVTFNPPEGLADRVRAIRGQVGRVFIVDNASAPSGRREIERAERVSGVARIDLPGNRGLAFALNVGVGRARAAGFRAALLFDHDSVPAPDMTARMLRAWARWRPEDSVAAVCPRIEHEGSGMPCLWFHRPAARTRRLPRVKPTADSEPQSLLFAIGSGLLVDVERYSELGGMSEPLFIDAVDTDFCLRACAAGQVIVGVPSAVLLHRLGAIGSKHRFGGKEFWPMNHSARRHYYIARNRIHLIRRHALRYPGWLELELRYSLMLLANVALFERQRARKIAMMVRGTLAGLLGRDGPFPG